MNDEGDEVELIKDGKKVKVTNKNKKVYAKKVAEYYINKDVKVETKEFLKGFY